MAARTTKKDLESKIALLEKKLQKLTDSVDLQKTSPKPASVKPKGTLPKGTAPKPTPEYVKPKGTLPKTTASAPKPAPAQTKPKGTMPKGFTPESASKPKPAETKNAPTNMAQALEKAYENWPMTSTADYKAKTPGYTPAPNRYFARQHGVVGKTTTKDWNIQKKAVTGYTAASDQYFATKQRLAYHPADKTFNGYGLKANGSAQQAPPPPPPPPKVETKPAPAPAKSKGTMPKGFNAESAPKPKPAPAQTKPQGTLPKGFQSKTSTCTKTCKSKGHTSKRILIFRIFYFLSCTYGSVYSNYFLQYNV